MTAHEAQLFWDSQDSQAAGWWLRYRDSAGTEHGWPLEMPHNATTEELAMAIEEERARLGGSTLGACTIRVYRGDEVRGLLTVPADIDGRVEFRSV